MLAVSANDGKVACFAAVPDGMSKYLAATAWLTPVLAEVGGRGGGKPAQAQGSGPDLDGIQRALEVAKSVAADALGH